MTAIVNLNHEPKLREAFEYAHVHNNTALIDRRTKWGNRFEEDARLLPRGEAIARYRADLWRRIRAGGIGLEELAALDGMWLACWSDSPCHGEVLARAAAWAASVLAEREAR